MKNLEDGLTPEPSRVRVRACAFCPWNRYPGQKGHACPGCIDNDDQEGTPGHLALRYEMRLYAVMLGICVLLVVSAVIWKSMT
jgi:hypothetical protein